jgi:hypothetical protein
MVLKELKVHKVQRVIQELTVLPVTTVLMDKTELMAQLDLRGQQVSKESRAIQDHRV